MTCEKKSLQVGKVWGKKSEDPKDFCPMSFCAEIDLCNKKKKQRTYVPTKSLGVVTLNLKKKTPKNGCVCVSLPFAWTQLAMVFFWVALTMSPGTMISFSFVSKGGGLSSDEILMPSSFGIVSGLFGNFSSKKKVWLFLWHHFWGVFGYAKSKSMNHVSW